MRRVWILVAFAALMDGVVAQRTWVVDLAGGPGVDFTDIPPAIAAAQPRDRVMVRGTGLYSGFTLGKGLDVEAIQSAAVPWIVVQGVPLADHALVTGFTVRDVDAAIFMPRQEGWMRVAQCAGTVTLSRLRVSTGLTSASLPPYTYIPAGIQVQNSRAVLIVDTQVAASAGANAVNWGYPTRNGNALLVTSSQVVVQRSTLTGAPGRTAPGTLNSSYPGAHGIWSLGGTVIGATVTAAGGRGGSASVNCFASPEAGGNGVEGDGVLLLGGSVLTAGTGGAPCWSGGPPGAPGLAISGVHRVTTDCTANGGLSSGVQPILPLPWTASPGVSLLGWPTNLTFHAQGSAAVVLFLDTGFDFTPVPGIDGPFLLTPLLFLDHVLTVSAAGTAPYTFTLPIDPVLRNRVFYFQGLALEPGAPYLALTNLGDLRVY